MEEHTRSPDPGKPLPLHNQDGFENLLQQISLPEYQAFIRSYAGQDATFKKEVELYFIHKNHQIDIGNRYKEEIERLIDRYSDRGFINYKHTFKLANEIDVLLQAGQDAFDQKQLQPAFAIASTVMEEMMKLVPDSDDSGGSIALTIEWAIKLIGAVASSAQDDPGLQEKIYAFLDNKLGQSLYFDYGDFGFDLYDIFQPLAIQLRKTDTVIHYLTTVLPRWAGNGRQEYFLLHRIDFLNATGREERADRLIRDNLHIDSLRQKEIDKALARQDYTAAKALVAGGIEIAENQNQPDLVRNGQKMLLHLAVLQNDVAALRLYAHHLAFDQGFNLPYYQQWKSSYPPEQWPAVLEKFVAQTIQNAHRKWESLEGKSWRSPQPNLLHLLGPVYIQEQMWVRLLLLVQQKNDLQTTLDHHKFLALRYPAELLQLYLPALEKAGHQANKRSAYARLAANMQMVMETIPAGKKQILDLAASLKNQYSYRPALVEELNKLFL